MCARKEIFRKKFPCSKLSEKRFKTKKMNFRPNEKDWVTLGVLALGLGVSRCLLFAILEEWEYANEIPYYQTGGALTKITLLREILPPKNRFFSQLFPSPS